MLKRRKVETRKQYEKRKRRRQFAISAALCGVDDNLPQPLHRSYWSKAQSPVSPGFDEEDAVLEIYDRHAAQTINKRRRPRGRSELYRQFEVNLSSSSSSCQTDSAHTLSHSDGILSNEESMLRLLQKKKGKSVQQSGSNAVKSKDKRDVAALGASHETVTHQLISPVLQKTAHPSEKLSSKISKGLQTGVGIFCCSFAWKQARVINLRSGPGMSLTEEKRLWRVALEGEEGIHCKREPSTQKGQIREIEVIPVDQTFQTTGAINYAEMEGVGMVFAPALLQKVPLSPSMAPVPWWKRDSWIGLLGGDSPDQEDQSAARISAHTKKASNTRSLPFTQVADVLQQDKSLIPIARQERKTHSPIEIRPTPIDLTDHDDSSSDARSMIGSTQEKAHFVGEDVKRGKKAIVEDVSFSDLDESLDHRVVRVSEARNQQVKLKAFQLAKSRGHQTLQTLNAKLGRLKGSADPGANDLRQEIGRPIYIPTLNHIYHDTVLDRRLDVSAKRPGHDLVTCESGSRIESESDLSLLVRQLDSKQKSQVASTKPQRKFDLHMIADPGAKYGDVEDVKVSTSPLLTALLAESSDSVSNETASLSVNGGEGSVSQLHGREGSVSQLQGRDQASSILAQSSARVVDSHLVLNEHFNQNDQGSSPTRGSSQHVFSIDPSDSPRLQKVPTNICISPNLASKAPLTKTKPPFGNNAQSPIQLHGNSSVGSQQKFPCVQSVISRDMGSEKHFNQSYRGRNLENCNHIDLTSCLTQLRTRSKSPVRLYGDPPFPVRMDGSPVREGLFFEPNKPCNHDETECNDVRDIVPRTDLRELTYSQKNRIDLSTCKQKVCSDPMKHVLDPVPLCVRHPSTPSFAKRENGVEDGNRVLRNASSWLIDHQRGPSFPAIPDNPVPMFIKHEGFNFDDDSLTASPWMKSLDLEMIPDDDSMTEELRQLEASEELLRKELSEIQLQRANMRMPTGHRTNNSLTIDCTRCESSYSLFPELRKNCSDRHLNNRYIRGLRSGIASQLECLSTDDTTTNDIVDVTAISSTSPVGESGLISNIIDLVLEDETGLDEGGLYNFLPIASSYQRNCIADKLPQHVPDLLSNLDQVHHDNESYDKIEVVFAEDVKSTYPATRAINEPAKIPLSSSQIIRIPATPSSSEDPRSPAISPGIHSPVTQQYNENPWNMRPSNSRRDGLNERFSSPISSTQFSGGSQCALNSRDMLKVKSCDSCADIITFGASPRYNAKLEPVQREVDQSDGEKSLRDSDGRYYPYFVDPTSPRERDRFDLDSDAAKYGEGNRRFLDSILVSGTLAVDNVGNVAESIVDRELSWQSVEQLYQLSPQVATFERYDRNKGNNTARSIGTFLESDWGISPNSSHGRLNTLVSDVQGNGSSANSSPNVLGRSADEGDDDKILTLSALDAKLQSRIVVQGINHPVRPWQLLSEDVGSPVVKAGDVLYSSASFESELYESHRVYHRRNLSWKPASEFPTGSRAHSSPLFSAYAETRYHLDTDDETDTRHRVALSLPSASSQEIDDDESERRFTRDLRFDEKYDVETKGSKRIPFQDLDARRRLQSLKERHQHLYYRDHNPKGTGRALEPVENGQTNTTSAHISKVRFNLNTDSLNPLPTLSDAILTKSGYDRNKRLGRLKKLQFRKHPPVNEQTQTEVEAQPSVQLRRRARTGVGLPRSFTEHYGHSSTRKPLVSNSNVNSGMLVEVFMPIIGAPLGGETKTLKKNADRATRDHSIASSTTRSRELVYALPSSAKSRNVAAAKPGSLLWQATAARDRL